MNNGSNFQVSEGTVEGTLTVTFPIKFKRIIIINDSGTEDLTFKFNQTETSACLKATETATLDIRGRDIIMTATTVPYRIWAIT